VRSFAAQEHTCANIGTPRLISTATKRFRLLPSAAKSSYSPTTKNQPEPLLSIGSAARRTKGKVCPCSLG
jgi:hypothetical protein